MERVPQVEFRDIDQVDPHGFAHLDLYGMSSVVEGHGVDGVDFVRAVEVGVEGVHHHDQLTCRAAPSWRVDDESSVQPFVDVSFERHHVTMVEMQAERPCFEFINELTARFDNRVHALHRGGGGAVEVGGGGGGGG